MLFADFFLIQVRLFLFNPRYNCTIERKFPVLLFYREMISLREIISLNWRRIERVVHYYPHNFKLFSRLSGHYPFWSILIPTRKQSQCSKLTFIRDLTQSLDDSPFVVACISLCFVLHVQEFTNDFFISSEVLNKSSQKTKSFCIFKILIQACRVVKMNKVKFQIAVLLETSLAFNYGAKCVAVLNTIHHYYFINRVNQLL